MDTRIIDGTALSRTIRSELRGRIAALRSAGVTPGLAVVFVGDDPASRIYVRNKGRACTEVGLHSEQHDLPASATEAQVLERVRLLNDDPRVHGILVQLPLPAHVSGERVLRAIAPDKDVDGFHPFNVGPARHRPSGIRSLHARGRHENARSGKASTPKAGTP